MSPAEATRRRWLAHEVVQTSAMDCGPAALKCLLEGHGIHIHYGRLREACQTSLDGTSIDTLEEVSKQLGLRAEQVLIPADHLALPQAAALPAIVVVNQADGATHFVVVWRRLGNWLQVMDPATGRRWVRSDRFGAAALRHRMSLPADDWRAWAASSDNLAPLRGRLLQLGAAPGDAEHFLNTALADPGWFALGALDASLRLVHTVVQAGGLARGGQAMLLLRALFDNTRQTDSDIFQHVPEPYWSAVPDVGLQQHASEADLALARQHLMVSGAVLMRVRGLHASAQQRTAEPDVEVAAPLSAELSAALRESQPHPLRSVGRLLREDGLLGPAALCAAMALAAAAVITETLLLRGVLDIASLMTLPTQRLLALAALLAFALLLLMLEVPIVTESLRYGRHLESRLRMALLAKLPRLNDRYFQSRAVSDMADRAHSIQQVRTVPMLGLNFVQSVAELLLTLLGVAWLAPQSAAWALGIVAAALLVPAGAQPLLLERELRLRNHLAALGGFYLDALLGLVPVRTHRAERALRRQHEGLLVMWAQASRATLAAGAASGALQSLLCQGCAAALLVTHLLRPGGAAISGGDLLLVYWVLKLPALAGSAGSLLRQYPVQRNVLLRLFEPLTAPEEITADAPRSSAPTGAGAAIRIEGGHVLAGGHTLLQGVDLHIASGEHVAVVGASGAGKSSLVGLFLGWHQLDQGRLLIDEEPLGASTLQSLRQQTAWVDPGVQLWNQSLLDNLLYASEDSALAQLGPVLAAAQLTDVVARLPQGLQTPLGEGGALLSGGEGQRVRLGRAMLQQGVRLALLDEPFRGLDREQRRVLLQRSRQWWQQATLLCVTHDVSETLTFDRVLVVDDGRIVEDGDPQRLAASDSHYARMLQEEVRLHAQAWQDGASSSANDASHEPPRWRHLRVEGGQVMAPHDR